MLSRAIIPAILQGMFLNLKNKNQQKTITVRCHSLPKLQLTSNVGEDKVKFFVMAFKVSRLLSVVEEEL